MSRPLAASLLVLICHIAGAQRPCKCSDFGNETPRTPDTVFHVAPSFCFALCGEIDRTATPVVYSSFTVHTWAYQGEWYPMIWLDSHKEHSECWISTTDTSLVLERLMDLPVGPGLTNQRVPYLRTELWPKERADGSGVDFLVVSIFIAKLHPPAPADKAFIEQHFQDQGRASDWTDEVLLRQVFLLAAFDKDWARRFRELPEKHDLGPAVAELHLELLTLLKEWETANLK